MRSIIIAALVLFLVAPTVALATTLKVVVPGPLDRPAARADATEKPQLGPWFDPSGSELRLGPWFDPSGNELRFGYSPIIKTQSRCLEDE